MHAHLSFPSMFEVCEAAGVCKILLDLFWTWFAYSIRPPSRLLHDLAVAELKNSTCVLQLCS